MRVTQRVARGGHHWAPPLDIWIASRRWWKSQSFSTAPSLLLLCAQLPLRWEGAVFLSMSAFGNRYERILLHSEHLETPSVFQMCRSCRFLFFLDYPGARSGCSTWGEGAPVHRAVQTKTVQAPAANYEMNRSGAHAASPNIHALSCARVPEVISEFVFRWQTAASAKIMCRRVHHTPQQY